MEQLLLHLRNLGFTEMESKIMVELATKVRLLAMRLPNSSEFQDRMCMRRYNALRSRDMYDVAKENLRGTVFSIQRSLRP